MKKRVYVFITLVLLLGALLAIKNITKEDDVPVEKPTAEEIIKEEKEIQEKQEHKQQEPEVKEEPKVEEPQEPEVKEEPKVEEPEVILTPQEQARVNLVEKHGEEVVDAWERLSRDEFFDYIGYKMVIQQHYGPKGEIYYDCYKILEDGTMKDAYVGGNYYVYGVFVSNEAMFDLIDYHNEFFAVK